jgi:hypothetical protein
MGPPRLAIGYGQSSRGSPLLIGQRFPQRLFRSFGERLGERRVHEAALNEVGHLEPRRDG